MKKIINIFNFGSGMSLKTHPGIGFTHSLAIVNYLYERFAGVVYVELNFRCACIN